jgi:hypothetical protein
MGSNPIEGTPSIERITVEHFTDEAIQQAYEERIKMLTKGRSWQALRITFLQYGEYLERQDAR